MTNKPAAVFSAFVGVSMLLMWGMFFFTGAIPELESEPLRIWLHIAAEVLTALALLAAAYGLWSKRSWGHPLFLVATGALIYTLIQSPGYFLQQGEWLFGVMFAVLLLLVLLLVVPLVRGAATEGKN